MRVLIYTILVLSSGTLFAQQQQTEEVEELNGTNNNAPVRNTYNSVPANVQLKVTEKEASEVDTTLQVLPKPVPVKAESLEKKSRNKSQKRLRNVQSAEPVPASDVKVLDDIEREESMSNEAYSESDSELESVKALEMKKVSTGFSSTYSTSDMQRTSRSPSYVQQTQMDQAVSYFEVNAPGSFESHYFKYVAGNYNTDLYSDLKAAEAIRPQNSDVHVQMAGYFMIQEDVDSALLYVEKLKKSDRLSENVVEYSSDILRSVPEDGALITHGFDDSYGSYYAQNSVGVRPDVTLISLNFLQSDTYKEELKDKGFQLPASEVVDVDYLAEFCVLNVDKSLSISLTTPKEYFKAIQDKLYVVGLVFEYHPDSYDNFSRNDYLWQNSMKKEVIMHPNDEKGKQLSANYLPMLLHLRKVYQMTGEEDKMKEVDEVSDQIGVQCRKYEQVQKVKASY